MAAGWWLQCLAVVFVAIALAELEDVALVEQLRDDAHESLGACCDGYEKTPGLSLMAGAAKQDGAGTVEECKDLCSSDQSCKSFNWCAKEKQCWTSTQTMSYDPNFFLYVKSKSSSTAGKFNSLPGLVFGRTGTCSEAYDCKNCCPGKVKEQIDCEKKCSGSCNSFSFAKSTKTCVVSGEGIEYN